MFRETEYEMRKKRREINKRTIVKGDLCQTLQNQHKLLIQTSQTLIHTLLLLRLLEGFVQAHALYLSLTLFFSLSLTHTHTLFAVMS